MGWGDIEGFFWVTLLEGVFFVRRVEVSGGSGWLLLPFGLGDRAIHLAWIPSRGLCRRLCLSGLRIRLSAPWGRRRIVCSDMVSSGCLFGDVIVGPTILNISSMS